ncbi:hypothetical protein [Haliscomenobacter hydrossis]|uniref:Uncharacterized protein n=1 Tax=Haliscomenobacter hydrossis (strain ATCC 27775 / DSM 1100 / LMG 10767 / O) TaxID=760192 RepID=F4KUF6_HALH1|nr:hypothetical protein [Haliscomenobacter hydrossis]AEE51238.1 hypothetical protein Halhy_3380 [Haliscomenobacter hydrossis DSM 1100]
MLQQLKMLVIEITQYLINKSTSNSQDFQQHEAMLKKLESVRFSVDELKSHYKTALKTATDFILFSKKQDKLLKELQQSHQRIYIDIYEYSFVNHIDLAEHMRESMEREFKKENKLIFDSMSYQKLDLQRDPTDIYRYVLKNKILKSIAGKNYLIFSLIIIDDTLTGKELLSLLIHNTLYGNRDEFHADPDKWGARLIWPYTKEGFEVMLKLLSEDDIPEIDEKLNLDDLAEQINNCNPEEVIQLFPKTIRNLKLRKDLKSKFHVKDLP